MTYTFIITTCIKNQIHFCQLVRCIKSIRQFHPVNKIYIINDSDEEIDLSSIDIYDNQNILVIPSYKKGCGELQIFKFILDCNDIDKHDNIIYLHDSVILKKAFINIESIEKVQFLWHFTNHRVHWDTIIEERNEYNIKNNIITHTDLISNYLKTYFYSNVDFLHFALDMLIHKDRWVGCMGLKCIINKNSLIEMNNIIPFSTIFLNFSTRRQRIVCESIFSIICHYCNPTIDFSYSYGGLYYDGFNNNIGANKPLGFDNLVLLGENEYFLKISFGR